ncbi:Endoglucanase 5A [Vibrio aerogenes CECT 7868]|uniref:Endoglucanase 5A n=1 Tax=Vibrio aerogenes CECT 7868 TaxID=1216006 RepID=A0A1M5ZNC0_9VIBR|nr:glycoside hydrolase family 5 protein [Vibrio aerogenes]SHI25596.1 Endoglucanase 5A [Vibrio aerogenes CECT 7868]
MKKTNYVGKVNYVTDEDYSVLIEYTAFDTSVTEGSLRTETSVTIEGGWVNVDLEDDDKTIIHELVGIPTSERDFGFTLSTLSMDPSEIIAASFEGEPVEIYFNGEPLSGGSTGETPHAYHGALRLGDASHEENPRMIYNQHDEQIQLCGLSLFWSNHSYSQVDLSDYWDTEGVAGIDVCDKVATELEAPIIRAAIAADNTETWNYENSYYDNPALCMNQVDKIVQAATAKGQYVVIDFHSHDANEYLEEAKTFFGDVSEKYSGHTNVIYEIFNEPVDQSWDTIKAYAEEVIPVIRNNDENALILVGTGYYSQEVDEAVDQPLEGENAFNVMYVFHYYGSCSDPTNCHDHLKAKLETWAQDVPIFISEYGHSEPSGDGEVCGENNEDWYEIVDRLGLSMCHWAISDKEESSAMFVHDTPLNVPWTGDVLTKSGGIIEERLLLRKGYSEPQNSVIDPGKDLHMLDNPSSTPGRHV